MRPFDHLSPTQQEHRDNLLTTPDEHLHDLELSAELDFLSDAVHRFTAGGLYLYDGAPGGGKSTLCVREGITVILVSHVTKRNEIAGPKTLEHGVDVCLVLRKAMLYTLLSVRKNRFGPTQLRGVPLMMEPSTTRFVKAPHADAQPSAATTYGGATVGVRQVQVAVSVPPDGQRAKVTAPGLPRREIDQLISCINQIEGLDLSELDHRIQCRMPRSGQYLT